MNTKFKKFVKVTICDVVLQLIIWTLFIIFKEVIKFEIKNLMIASCILYFVFLIFYFFVFSRWVDKFNIDNIKFHSVFLVNWLVMSILFYFFITHLELSGLHEYCWNCIVGGEEYLFFMLGLSLLSIIIPFIYILYILFKSYKKVRAK